MSSGVETRTIPAGDGRELCVEIAAILRGSRYWSTRASRCHGTCTQVWQRARSLALTPSQVASPLARRPYDLRHGGGSLRLNAGVPATQVAEWAGHSVEVLLTIYAKCIHGWDQVWYACIERALGQVEQ